MTAITRLNFKPDTAAGGGGQDRYIELLRQIAESGGKVAPSANRDAARGYEYPNLPSDSEKELLLLAEHNYLEARFFDRIKLCPKCGSHHLNTREICPNCRRSHITGEGLLHHFRCGNVGLPSEFTPTTDGGYICPKCNRAMHHLGTEYDRLGRAFVCHGCGIVSDNPPLEAACLACGARTPGDDLIGAEFFTYVLTSRGAEAIRHGSLFDSSGGDVSIADASVYRRSLTLEFLEHEMKCLQHFKCPFCLLLIEHRLATGGRADEAPTPWLNRVREYLRETDIIGRLGEALFVVIMPQTKRKTADALCKRIADELGPMSPLSLVAMQISEPQQARTILARHVRPGKTL